MFVTFSTPDELDINALRTFGLHDKPNTDNPIGFFGTGLKYAIAVLLRNGAKIRMYIGDEEYRFKVKKTTFRSKEVTIPTLQKKRKKGGWTTYQLPFTLELGKTWEIWMALRELESNTRDEQGFSNLWNDCTLSEYGSNGGTCIAVEHPEFLDAYQNLGKIFLMQSDPWLVLPGVEVYREPSKHLYYRGLRVYDMPEKQSSKFTYNLTNSQLLTEDRTLKYLFLAVEQLTYAVMQVDRDGWDFARSVCRAQDKHFESRFEFDMANRIGSETFNAVVKSLKNPSSRLSTYYGSYLAPPVKIELPLSRKLKTWMEGNHNVDTEFINLLEQIHEYLDAHDM